ncbi:type I-C CRISPR-associated protein Cas8c/Csd1 [Spiractinospora alimapuensis]|uniref:type I-C CRISPR-associated protein Cas8c/Csd1 n=1 Tax=Spiractinospora alimapuensis TaxID=2820884 RepID=UPI001F21381B|nr:type I-C CRISPR-associated protein Cas8c/Csd1 [Spiractinospora alimapuensis]QVQ53395.1 type I-C CRISPR-associated protein Cas8c/Csd1 [Spiractinospora alimapuensis]
MLLKALADYAPHVNGLPPANYRPRTVRWCISLDEDGFLLDVDGDGNPSVSDLADTQRKNGITLDAPYVYRSGAKPPPTLLVDTLEYVLGMPKQDTEKAEDEAARRNEAYIELLQQWAQTVPSDPAAHAVLNFFTSGRHRALSVPQQAKSSHLVAVNVAGRPWPHLDEAAQQCWAGVVATRKTGRAGRGTCLSCGEERPLLNSLPESVKAGAIPVPSTAQARDAQLVSVNKPAQGRGGRIQLDDIPLCEVCGARSTAVLNALLSDTDHRYRGQDSVTVWWLKDPQPVPLLGSLLTADAEDIAAVYAELHKARRHGPVTTGLETNTFHAVTLSAHQSRVAVRDWINVPLDQALERITQWFDDHEITDWHSDTPRKAPLWLLARCLGRGQDTADGWRYIADSEPARASRDLLHAALRGATPTPVLLHRLNQRIGADGRIDHPRAALLRLLYNRIFATDDGRVHAVLNEERTDPAYVAGRLFAVLESLQYRALRDPKTKKGPNATIADKVLSAAKATPRARMEPLLDKSQAHLRRLRNTDNRKDEAAGRAYFDTICRLHDLLDQPLPSTLDQEGQSLFSLGYYQQHSHDHRQRRNATPPQQDEGQ